MSSDLVPGHVRRKMLMISIARTKMFSHLRLFVPWQVERTIVTSQSNSEGSDEVPSKITTLDIMPLGASSPLAGKKTFSRMADRKIVNQLKMSFEPIQSLTLNRADIPLAGNL